MAAKLSIKIDPEIYPSVDYRSNVDRTTTIKTNLTTIFDNISVQTARFFQPSRETIKVSIANEKDIEKVFSNITKFTEKGFEPRLTMALRASFTIFITGYDISLTQTYNADDIKKELIDQGWKVENVFILKSKKAFKVQLKNRDEVNKFLNTDTIPIGGIQLTKKQIDKEVNPVIPQCWKCGRIQAGHHSDNCPNTQICLKCNSTQHQFPECPIPKDVNEMTTQHKERRFCVPCNNSGNHTSLDHRACPTKRRMVQDRIKESRKLRDEEDEKLEEEKKTFQKAFEYISNEYPLLPNTVNKNTTVATITTLALLDEAINPGTFQENFNKACDDNNIGRVIYQPNPRTAKAVFQAICTPLITPETANELLKSNDIELPRNSTHGSSSHTFRIVQSGSLTQKHLRFINDQEKNKKRNGQQDELDESQMDDGTNQVNNLNKKPRQLSIFTTNTELPSSEKHKLLIRAKQIMESTKIMISDPAVKSDQLEGVRNMTIKELYNLITSNACKNSSLWREDQIKLLTTLMSNNMEECKIQINYIAHPESFFGVTH